MFTGENVQVDQLNMFCASYVEEEETKDLPFRLPETFYDVRVKERYNNQYTSISRISSGSKKIFFILTLVIAAEINKIPLLLLEELENSVHPRLLQNLLTAICN